MTGGDPRARAEAVLASSAEVLARPRAEGPLWEGRHYDPPVQRAAPDASITPEDVAEVLADEMAEQLRKRDATIAGLETRIAALETAAKRKGKR